MKSEKFLYIKKNTDNSGFSIVELIIAVAILAAVVIPVLRSFTMAAVTNSKAQKVQDVTSVAERIMEEVKGCSIKELYSEATTSSNKDSIVFLSGDDAKNYLSSSTYSTDSDNFNNAPYVLLYDNVTATQGRTYNICVKIDPEEYDKASATDASNINSTELPQLYDIQDSSDHVVLSWEMSKYDSNSLNNLVEINTKEDNKKTNIKNTIMGNGTKGKGIKTTTITFSDSGSNSVDVSCDVSYESGDNAYTKTLKYNVYSGKLENLEVNKNSNGGPHAYLFYKMSAIGNSEYMPNEVVNVVDTTSSGVHNVYFMLQNDGNIHDLKYRGDSKIADIELKYNGNTIAKSNSESYILTKTHWDKSDLGVTRDVDFYTNLTSNNPNVEQGKLFDVKKKSRVYKVTVSVFDGNNLQTELVSSMRAGEEAK